MPLHPFIAAMLHKIAAEGRPALSAGSPDDGRAMVAAMRRALGAGPAVGPVRDIAVPTRAGSVQARLLLPEAAPLGLVIYLHGGGWVIGTPEDFEALARLIVAKSGCAVLLPDYRLAPEHPFPAGLEDCEDIARFAAREVRSLCGADVPLVLAGDSAGANLGTVVARRLKGEVQFAFQALVYPVTDSDLDRPSYRELSEGMPLTRTDMAWFFDHYAPADRRVDPDISPLRAESLSGLPPALIVTAEYDVLRDEGEAYAEALRAAGVPVTLRRIDGLTHGFARLHNHVELVDQTMTAMAQDIAAACRASTGA